LIPVGRELLLEYLLAETLPAVSIKRTVRGIEHGVAEARG